MEGENKLGRLAATGMIGTNVPLRIVVESVENGYVINTLHGGKRWIAANEQEVLAATKEILEDYNKTK